MRHLICFCSLLPATNVLAAPPEDARTTAETASAEAQREQTVRIVQVLNDILETHQQMLNDVRALRAEIAEIRSRLRILDHLNNDLSAHLRTTRNLALDIRDSRAPSASLIVSAAGNNKIVFAGPLLQFSYTGFDGVSFSIEAGGGITNAAARAGGGINWRPGGGPIGGGFQLMGIWTHALDSNLYENVGYALAGIGPRTRWRLWGEWSPWAVRANANFLGGIRQRSWSPESSTTFGTIFHQKKTTDLFLGWETDMAIELRF